MKQDKEFLKRMGEKIKATRKKRKISLQDLGMVADRNFDNIWRIERGDKDCQILTLKHLADALKVDIKDFL